MSAELGKMERTGGGEEEEEEEEGEGEDAVCSLYKQNHSGKFPSSSPFFLWLLLPIQELGSKLSLSRVSGGNFI